MSPTGYPDYPTSLTKRLTSPPLKPPMHTYRRLKENLIQRLMKIEQGVDLMKENLLSYTCAHRG